MRILVTGGAGFIGSNLVDRLVKEYPDAIINVLDNLSTGSMVNYNHSDRVFYYPDHTANCNYFLDFAKSDIIFHFGEYSRIATSFGDIDQIIHSNIRGTMEVLELWRVSGAKLIYAGSSSIYADPHLNPYSLSKLHNVNWINDYAEWYGLKRAITYFYNVYGPRQIRNGKMATVIGIFEEQYLFGNPLPVVGDGSQKRDLTHVDDIVDGLILAMEKGDGDNYNLGFGNPRRIIDIAHAFEHPIEFIAERRGERFNSTIDGTKAKDELGWEAKIDVIEYIKQWKKEHEKN